MPKLEDQGIAFNLPVPGGIIEAGLLQANSPFPGLMIEYSIDNGNTWHVYNETSSPQVAQALIRTRSGSRYSRVASVQ
ncbi:chitobiase/beta-hexosaminidase C-terminal domain-containing protein [Vibrio sp. ZSDZ65]|uniref:Chitobiase/beta-hexosaminidase C-terminal domain-containing protein n=1 Tax=Vibrio qingdaonensis TaxID=2829491 RepID=A0A9X3HXW4_9VIBR|nr:chitobiase/beta-hexosaminidase C-terminal domain-containing protein [Vibrio qingdaonensis]MCW8347916.1 chitobiase/beta-hexosaminidase C-terminal domain-containing protein [Vibrio qingdaonensis]